MLVSPYIIIGPAGPAMRIMENDVLYHHFDMPGTVPHVTIRVAEGCRSRDVGPMMLDAEETEWQVTKNPEVQISADKTYTQLYFTHILHGQPLIAELTPHTVRVRLHDPMYTRNCPLRGPYCLYQGW